MSWQEFITPCPRTECDSQSLQTHIIVPGDMDIYIIVLAGSRKTDKIMECNKEEEPQCHMLSMGILPFMSIHCDDKEQGKKLNPPGSSPRRECI
jgi:hypothetical protein